MDYFFLSDATFWVAVSFFIFISLTWKPIGRFLGQSLDARSERISKELREAVSLREEAQSLLAEYQRKQRENMDEAKRIIEQTKADAQAMADKAEQELRDTLEKRKAMAMEKIAQAEIHALKMVQKNVVDIALIASRETISNQIDQEKLLKDSLEDIAKQLSQKAV